MPKKPSNFTMSDEARKLLSELAKAGGVSRSAVLERLIRAAWRRK